MLRSAKDELERRLSLWNELRAQGGPSGLAPALIKALRLHRGQQGIFRDLKITQMLGYASGVAVGLLHTGRVYTDDLSVSGLVYHYPATVRGGRDENEVHSIKLCRELRLPLFVVITPHRRAATRDVRLGWVEDWNDEDSSILIRFSVRETDVQNDAASGSDKSEFVLRSVRSARQTLARIRPNQWRFRFDVLKRYGRSCAVCEIINPKLLNAAHLCPVHEGGSDDARNGLVFCLNHHRAFDERLFRIEPDTLEVVVETLEVMRDLGITRSSIRHLRHLPHPNAVAWAFGES